MSEADKGKLQASFQISRQLDQEKISFLSNRIGELLKSNNDLRTSASRNEKDTHDIVLYFQREMEMKDEIITKLNEELVKRETQLKFELEKMKKKFEGEINDLKSESENTISSLTTRLTDAEAELSAVDMFVNDKQAFMLQLQRLESEVKQQRQQMFDALDEQERKFLEEKSHLLKDLDEQRAMLQENALRDARNAMGAETKKIRAENNRMHEEVKFLLSTTTELQTDKVWISVEYLWHLTLYLVGNVGVAIIHGSTRGRHPDRERGGICKAVFSQDQRNQVTARKVIVCVFGLCEIFISVF